jgi:hypothetical protein
VALSGHFLSVPGPHFLFRLHLSVHGSAAAALQENSGVLVRAKSSSDRQRVKGNAGGRKNLAAGEWTRACGCKATFVRPRDRAQMHVHGDGRSQKRSKASACAAAHTMRTAESGIERCLIGAPVPKSRLNC